MRGVTKRLQTPYSNSEDTQNGVTSFNDNGFSIGNYGDSNGNGRGYVAWCWKAGGNKNTFNVDGVGYATTTAAGLTAGDVSPTGASVGTKQGFSIIRWTAPTWNGSPQQVPHGLTQSPSFIIAKATNNAASWYCYHEDTHATNPHDEYILLNESQSKQTLADSWGTSAPNSTTFGDRQLGWNDGKDVISYIWHDVPGLQKFGTYTGNGNVDGTFIELGFRASVVWVKRTDSTENWYMIDTTRDTYNRSGKSLQANTSNVEPSVGGSFSATMDVLSNGFKLRDAGAGSNASGGTYIYCAWAEAPSINLYGAQANAR